MFAEKKPSSFRNFFVAGSILVVVLSGCSVVENVHVYFNRKTLRILNAKRTDFFDVVVVENGERLSDISYKLTGTRNTKYILEANPKIKSDILKSGTRLRIPTAILKPGVRAQLKIPRQAQDRMGATQEEIQNSEKTIKKIKIPQIEESNKEVEILPGKTKDTFDEDSGYDKVPFHTDTKPITPYVTPKATPDKKYIEEQKLRDKYKEILKQLD